ncbi:MAG: LysR family transcriptional regulator for metE and metH [Flavobacteriales bacterium]|jgi:LysR family transcriptional regulator for metE and metH
MIERIHLNILREIERKGSLTAAAVALNLTQPALSHTIKKLEHRIGTRLWTKEGRQLRFTQAGDFLLKEANRLLPQFERVDEVMDEFATGGKGVIKIGMECHPCYQWLLRVVEPFLNQWPGVDIDVKQRFRFGGMAALYNHEIDILVTPDPIQKNGISFLPVFDYEQVLVLNKDHPLAGKEYARAQDLSDLVLYTYPVEVERLDVYKEFLIPASCSPKKRKVLEATEIMLQMVAAGRGVATLPKWLVNEYSSKLPITSLRLGEMGIAKKIHLGVRDDDRDSGLASEFLALAKTIQATSTSTSVK